MRGHLRRRSCPLNLLYGSIINIIIIKKIRAFKACKTSQRDPFIFTELSALRSLLSSLPLKTFSIFSTQALPWEHWITRKGFVSSAEKLKTSSMTFQSSEDLNPLQGWRKSRFPWVILLEVTTTLKLTSPADSFTQIRAPDLFW